MIDRFHVEKNLLEAITKLRRQIQRSLPPEKQKELKGTRWLMVRNYDELDEEQKQILDAVLDHCPELALVHHLKEEFRDWYEETEEIEEAGEKLEEWTEVAASVGSIALNNFLKTVGNWKAWILNYFNETSSWHPAARPRPW
ncbi:MAG: ISL3 family transposase [Blastocatellia bacterium]